MLTRRPSLATVRLCVLLLLSSSLELPAEAQTRIKGKETMHKVRALLNTVTSLTRDLDCQLYTPGVEDYRKCPVSTIKCFALEVRVLVQELDSGPYQKMNLTGKLEKLTSSLNQTESQCVQCELFQEKNAAEFLLRLLNILEEMNWANT
ncbi:interleukin 15, like isoform X2 [Nelusetta ayraudi]|uniref:interleukin 15, like isoform X2 n=1 Tax=Nelusetta ayraudi TaxID=303726 RepID=UPI003F6E570A